MNCIICAGPMGKHFSKHFNAYNLGKVDYRRCDNCGFSASATHFDMSNEEWEALNLAFHNDSEARVDNPYNRNQRYFNQALMLHLMKRNNLIAPGKWLDWGSGSGALSSQLQENFDIELHNFDKFMQPKLLPLSQEKLVERGYSLVVNTAVFEHVRNRQTLDEIESYVAEDGAFAIHTLVRGSIPADPSWMYLLPVHCSFHTNRSMEILMQQWGYTCSAYNEHSKMWILFKHDPDHVSKDVSSLNNLLGWEYLHFKPGFMDYWP
jgi:hypothetical protein